MLLLRRRVSTRSARKGRPGQHRGSLLATEHVRTGRGAGCNRHVPFEGFQLTGAWWLRHGGAGRRLPRGAGRSIPARASGPNTGPGSGAGACPILRCWRRAAICGRCAHVWHIPLASVFRGRIIHSSKSIGHSSRRIGSSLFATKNADGTETAPHDCTPGLSPRTTPVDLITWPKPCLCCQQWTRGSRPALHLRGPCPAAFHGPLRVGRVLAHPAPPVILVHTGGVLDSLLRSISGSI